MSSTSMKPRTSRAQRTVWIVIAVAVLAMVLTIVIANLVRADEQETLTSEGGAQVVREDSRIISQAPQEKAVLVEFLDFECEACRAAKPFVDELKEEYDQNLTIVARYFPLPGHINSMNAALAVEAAAQQRQFVPMLDRMYETQEAWGEASESKADVFRGFAQELGLDMAAFDAAVADPQTQARIERDVADGTALQVAGTPTFFLDGELVEAATLEEFRALIADSISDEQ
ncbi:thioredoxin domain-containing protein [uncultured Arthrobacter sp.]|uniref:DsbA family protein n=1 Tax=uncultured Arthrobacter sp. TaxID=114050 RepID=UPI00262440C1|nr:thioredoxin domain-containing protein [uncultured Arthrobacter sp.]